MKNLKLTLWAWSIYSLVSEQVALDDHDNRAIGLFGHLGCLATLGGGEKKQKTDPKESAKETVTLGGEPQRGS